MKALIGSLLFLLPLQAHIPQTPQKPKNSPGIYTFDPSDEYPETQPRGQIPFTGLGSQILLTGPEGNTKFVKSVTKNGETVIMEDDTNRWHCGVSSIFPEDPRSSMIRTVTIVCVQ